MKLNYDYNYCVVRLSSFKKDFCFLKDSSAVVASSPKKPISSTPYAMYRNKKTVKRILLNIYLGKHYKNKGNLKKKFTNLFN